MPAPYGLGLYGLGPYGEATYAPTGPFANRLYESLPTLYRDADGSGQLLAYLRLLGDQANNVEEIFNRISYTPPDDKGLAGDTSDLADPATADRAWLPWLAATVGVTLPPGTTEQGMRDAIANAVSGFRAGTKPAVAAAAASALTGSRYVQVYDHSISSPGDGDEWDVMIVTRPSETPDAAAVLQAVIDKNAKPTGVTLHHQSFSSSWSTVTSAYPTWASRAGKTWAELEETGL